MVIGVLKVSLHSYLTGCFRGGLFLSGPNPNGHGMSLLCPCDARQASILYHPVQSSNLQ